MTLSYEAAVARVEAMIDLNVHKIAEVDETSYGWIFTVGPAATSPPTERIPDGVVGSLGADSAPPGWEVMLIGGNEIVVDAGAEDVFWMPDIHPHEGETWESVEQTMRAALEAGFRHNYYDITIRSVRSIGKTAHQLAKLGLGYVIPEVDGDITWTIPQGYSLADLIRMMEDAPVTFTMQELDLHRAYLGFTALAATDCCDFSWEIVTPPAKPLLHKGPPPP